MEIHTFRALVQVEARLVLGNPGEGHGTCDGTLNLNIFLFGSASAASSPRCGVLDPIYSEIFVIKVIS